MGSRDFNPLDIFLQIESDMRRSAEEALRAVRFQPYADIYETGAALIIKIELAGVRPEKLNITLSSDDRLLTITGERNEPPQEQRERVRYYQLEIYFGDFEREIVLPSNVRFDREQITANYRDGFLVISLPKRAESPSGSRMIEISNEDNR